MEDLVVVVELNLVADYLEEVEIHLQRLLHKVIMVAQVALEQVMLVVAAVELTKLALLELIHQELVDLVVMVNLQIFQDQMLQELVEVAVVEPVLLDLLVVVAVELDLDHLVAQDVMEL